jgi:hypothetical protein
LYIIIAYFVATNSTTAKVGMRFFDLCART